jgi:ribosomal protein S18 acetylase RimI-like enzyme
VNPKIEIRKGTPEDLNQLLKAQVQMAYESESVHLDEQSLKAGLQAVLSDSSLGQYWIAFSSQRSFLGTLMITREWSDWRNGFVLWIQSVFVAPEFRRQGIYRALYSFIKQKAEDDPLIVGVRLYVEKENERAIQTYRRLGMNSDRYVVCEWLKTSH